jgi:hypothetical protein
LVFVRLIEEEPEFTVAFVDVLISNAVAVLNVTVLDPSAIVLTLLLLDDREPAVTL